MGTRCTVLGAGSWGTALAVQLARQGHETLIWDRNPDRCDVINTTHVNPRYLTSVSLPESLVAVPDLETATRHAELLVTGVPSHALRDVMVDAAPFVGANTTICCATKGVENGTLDTMAEVLRETLPGHEDRITILSGPSFALELAKGLPTAVVIAGPDGPAHEAAEAFHGQTFRAYHTEDVVGVCIGGSLKNVMAIACGVSDGAGFGSNARAAIITRGLAEISRLAVAMGANPLTMMGLAGMGDLVLTCTGNLSRNRRVGLALGEGRTLQDILDELGEVAEGVTTAKSAYNLAKRVGVELPITEQVYKLLYEDKPVMNALLDLLGRERRAERD
ncbi:MAG: NAD(P)-dependent glycerol-3-phosphate dehydrogenase [Deltaproteobacteria bacterium]|nr:MAG: NAD(P)-dependent glycerol-3-phosphate dehydrogenase [Deltaproteobacteria bacterium]